MKPALWLTLSLITFIVSALYAATEVQSGNAAGGVWIFFTGMYTSFGIMFQLMEKL